jgi:hypothetical protein
MIDRDWQAFLIAVVSLAVVIAAALLIHERLYLAAGFCSVTVKHEVSNTSWRWDDQWVKCDQRPMPERATP